MTQPQQQAQKQSGCLKVFIWVAASLGILLVLGVVGCIIGYNMLMNYLRDNYTSDVPMAIEQPATTGSQKARVKTLNAKLRSALEQGRETIVKIDNEDFNQFLAGSNETSRFARQGIYSLDGDIVSAKMTFPLDMLNIGKFKGRHINGDFKFKVKVWNGLVNIDVISADVLGRPLPPMIVNSLNKQDWNAHFNNHFGTNWLDGIDAISVENSSFIIKTKKK